MSICYYDSINQSDEKNTKKDDNITRWLHKTCGIIQLDDNNIKPDNYKTKQYDHSTRNLYKTPTYYMNKSDWNIVECVQKNRFSKFECDG